MSKKCIFSVLLIIFLSAFIIVPSGAIAVEAYNVYVTQVVNSSKLIDVVISWTTDAAGDFVARTFSSTPPMDIAYPVYVNFIYTDPDSPTDDYDLSFVSSEFPDIDIFGQAAYNRDSTNPEMVEPTIQYMPIDLNKITFDVLNAGITESGVVKIRCIRAN